MELYATKGAFETLKVDLKDSVALITLNRPQAMNALNSQMLSELSRVFSLLEQDPTVSGAILTGEGKAFVAGADIAQMLPYKSEEGVAYAAIAQGVFNQIENARFPVIAAVNGYALGGGCELALSCDIRFACETAVFGQPEVNLGVIPCFGGTQRLPRVVGPSIAKEMIFTGRFVKAEEAKALGLVNKVLDASDLLCEAIAMIKTISSKGALAVKYAKLAINKSADMDLQSGLELERSLAGLTFATEDKEEGMSAFIEKRSPQFKKR